MRSLVGTLADAARMALPVPLSSKYVRQPWRGRRTDAEYQAQMMANSGTLFSIVDGFALSTSMVDWQLWREGSSGLPEDRKLVTAHPALSIWNKPNDFYTRQEFVQAFQQHIDLVGEGWWVIEKIGNRPISMVYVMPWRISPVPDPERFIAGYVYTSPDGEQVPLEVDEVIMLKGAPNPHDPYRGIGPVQSVLVDLEQARYSAQWNLSFFRNSALPGGIIEVPETLNDKAFNRLRMQWADGHQGISNAHRVALLEGGQKWVPNSVSHKDMEFTGLGALSTQKIREAYRFPKFAAGDVDDVNRATAEASDAMYSNRLIVPRLERIKQALNQKFLPMFGGGRDGWQRQYTFDYVNPTPPNIEQENATMTAKVDAVTKLVESGVDPDDACDVVGLPRMVWSRSEREVAAV